MARAHWIVLTKEGGVLSRHVLKFQCLLWIKHRGVTIDQEIKLGSGAYEVQASTPALTDGHVTYYVLRPEVAFAHGFTLPEREDDPEIPPPW